MLTCTGHTSALPRRPLVNTLGSGQGGAFILLLQLFMAITSTGSAEIIAVPSLTVLSLLTFLRTAPKYSPELALFHRVCTAGCVDDLRDEHRRLADLVDFKGGSRLGEAMLSSSEVRSLSTEVSSILTYDIFYTYIQPELKETRENRKKLFFKVCRAAESDRSTHNALWPSTGSCSVVVYVMDLIAGSVRV